MLKDAIEAVSDGFKVRVVPGKGDEAFIESDSPSESILGLFPKRQREFSKMRVRNVGIQIGSTSPNAYALYEREEIQVGVEKLDRLLNAMGAGLTIGIRKDAA